MDLRELIPHEQRLASLGEIAGPVVHEISNYLNSMLLQVAVMEQLRGAGDKSDLARIQEGGRELAQLLNRFRQYRKDARTEFRPVDLNPIVENVCSEAHGTLVRSGTTLLWDLGKNLPAISGLATDLRRLCWFLLINAEAATGHEGTIWIRTDASSDMVSLWVIDSGSPVPEDMLEGVFEFHHVRSGGNALEMAACKTMVERMEGTITASNTEEGFGVHIHWPMIQEK